MILKDPQTNDTRLSDEPIEGWVEITQEELEAIYETRRVAPVAPPEVVKEVPLLDKLIALETELAALRAQLAP